jgi:hypothetical protein
MMKQIRNSTFETNSSSSHSFTLGTDPSKLRKPVDVEFSSLYDKDSETILVEGGEFGWGIETLTSWEDRLNYLYAQAAYKDESRGIFEKLNYVISEYLGYDVMWTGVYPSSYVDHQSVGITDEIFYSDESIINFVFNSGTTVTIDNDNH